MDYRDNVETGESENLSEPFYVPIPEETPLKREQEKLSGVVKNVHRKLRRKYREGKLPLWAPVWPSVLRKTLRVSSQKYSIRSNCVSESLLINPELGNSSGK